MFLCVIGEFAFCLADQNDLIVCLEILGFNTQKVDRCALSVVLAVTEKGSCSVKDSAAVGDFACLDVDGLEVFDTADNGVTNLSGVQIQGIAGKEIVFLRRGCMNCMNCMNITVVATVKRYTVEVVITADTDGVVCGIMSIRNLIHIDCAASNGSTSATSAYCCTVNNYSIVVGLITITIGRVGICIATVDVALHNRFF